LRCVDEAKVRRHPTLTAQWCLAGDVPEVPTGDEHTKVHVYGAVAPRTGRTHHHISPKLSQEAFARFLRRLLRYYRGKRLLVIHDRAAQQKGRPIDMVLQAAEGRLVLMPQAAYFPELNPQERIGKWLRRVVTHHHWFEPLNEQVQAVRDFFCYLAGVKAQVRHLCALKTSESFVASLLGGTRTRSCDWPHLKMAALVPGRRYLQML
jgi:hypothetical protein